MKDIQEFEKSFGKIPNYCLVIARTGWEGRWNDPSAYRNVVVGSMIFPTFSVEAAELLLKRNISGIGIDTLSPDGPNSGFPVHEKILGAGKIILENLANLEKLPLVGSWVISFPLKIRGGTELPLRVVGVIP